MRLINAAESMPGNGSRTYPALEPERESRPAPPCSVRLPAK